MMHRLFTRCLLMCGLIACNTGPALAALGVDFDASDGVFTVGSDAADDIVVDCEFFFVPESINGGGDFFVTINGSLPPIEDVLCADVKRFVVNGGPGDNLIDFIDGLDPAEFTVLLNTMVTGGPGNDRVFGTFVNDNNFWRPGDGSDTFDGRGGHDQQAVEGGDAGERFTIGNGTGGFDVRLERTDPASFSVDIVNAEGFQVGSGGGDDTIDAGALDAGRIRLVLFGDAGDDTITGSGGDDYINGGPGNDMLIGGPGADTILGLAGKDTSIWNPGDGSDTFDGDTGDDRQIVNGAAGAETFVITAGSPGFDARFDRIAPGPFGIDIVRVENMQLNANDGLDTVTTEGLPGIAQLLDGGDPAAFPGDTLAVPDFDGDLSETPVVGLPGTGPIEHVNFEFEPAGVGTLILSPDPLDFGAVDVGEIAGPLELTLTNTGNAEVNVDAVSAPAAPFAGAGGSCGDAPFTLLESASCTLAYTFAPTGAGLANSAVTVASDAGNGPRHSAVLSGTGNEEEDDGEEGEAPPTGPIDIPALSPAMLLLLALLLGASALPAVRRMT